MVWSPLRTEERKKEGCGKAIRSKTGKQERGLQVLQMCILHQEAWRRWLQVWLIAWLIGRLRKIALSTNVDATKLQTQSSPDLLPKFRILFISKEEALH